MQILKSPSDNIDDGYDVVLGDKLVKISHIANLKSEGECHPPSEQSFLRLFLFLPFRLQFEVLNKYTLSDIYSYK